MQGDFSWHVARMLLHDLLNLIQALGRDGLELFQDPHERSGGSSLVRGAAVAPASRTLDEGEHIQTLRRFVPKRIR